MSFLSEMEDIAHSLETLGCSASTPVREERDFNWTKMPIHEATVLKKSFVDGYLSTILRSDAILIANFTKHEIEGYVGPNTLMEAAFGYALGKPVVFLYDPSAQACGLECVSIVHGFLNGNVNNLTAMISGRTADIVDREPSRKS